MLRQTANAINLLLKPTQLSSILENNFFPNNPRSVCSMIHHIVMVQNWWKLQSLDVGSIHINYFWLDTIAGICFMNFVVMMSSVICWTIYGVYKGKSKVSCIRRLIKIAHFSCNFWDILRRNGEYMRTVSREPISH